MARLIDPSRSLFDVADIWRSDPMEAFIAFVQSEEFQALGQRPGHHLRPVRPVKASSVHQFRTMFGKVLRHLGERGKDLFTADMDDIVAFFPADAMTKETRWKYLRLLERVFAHLHARAGITDRANPATAAAIVVATRPEHQAARPEQPTVALDAAAQARLVATLRDFAARPVREPGPHAWKGPRDAALVAIMLGGGLTVAETLGLAPGKIGVPDTDGVLHIELTPGTGAWRTHRTRLDAFATPFVLGWARLRQEMRIPGPHLFPAARNGKPLKSSTLYYQVQAVMERAGVSAPHLGGRTLRNSFAVRELAAGRAPEHVSEMMGHHRERAIGRYLDAKRRLHGR